MKLIQLKIFRDIAYTKSFVKAAKLNYITQPSISVHLKQLEEELQVKLFDRVPRSVVLTQVGSTYLIHAEEILSRCENLLALGDDTNNNIKGVIRIASIYSIGMYELGPFLRFFMEKYPGIEINLEYQDAYNVYDLVKKRKAHIGMVAYPKEHLKVNAKVYGEDRLVLIVPSSHPFAQKKNVSINQITGEDFIAFDSNTPTREKIDDFFKRNKVSANIKMVNNNIFALKKAVEAGIGISIVPSSTVKDEVRRGDLCEVNLVELKLSRPLAILTPKNYKAGKIEQIFINSLVKYNDTLSF
jgi:DNA-binding transcriptional LysR family regulator